MDSKKKILILYASAGHGHAKAASSILESFQDSDREVETKFIDTLSPEYHQSGKLYREFYLFQIRYLPKTWGFFYWALDIRWVYLLARLGRRVFNAINSSRLAKFIEKENPDVIISTHFLSNEVASHLKIKRKIHSKLITVVTDYLPHYIWTEKAIDEYVVALEETKEELVKRGVSQTKIHVLGIPIGKNFLHRHPRTVMSARAGLRPDMFTVLVTSGGAGMAGIGNIASGILKLQKPIQIIVVCGTNKKLYDLLSVGAGPLMKVLGFVNNMDELMEAVDLVIGKAGGLTVTESLVKNKPLLFFQSVPGQETRNVYCVEKYGAGQSAHDPKKIVDIVSDLYNNPQKLETMKNQIVRMAKPFAARDIRDLARKLCDS